MPTQQVPNAYIEEHSSSPSSVAEVGSAIPAFIGHTGMAKKDSDGDLLRKPTRITSLAEFELYFGGAHTLEVSVDVDDDGNGGFDAVVHQPEMPYLLYYCMQQFFENDGGPCFVVSVGDYGDDITDTDLIDGLDLLRDEDEPTLIVVPEAVKVPDPSQYANIVQAVLKQCADLGDRFGIFDFPGGDHKLGEHEWAENRELFASENLQYGAAYYPFLKTALIFFVTENDEGIFGENVLVRYPASDPDTVGVKLTTFKQETPALYSFVRNRLGQSSLILPPSAAVAGVYLRADRTRGVWKAPANIGLSGIMKPVVMVDNETQAWMSMDLASGKSINAIRHFAGQGVLVWGGRTLAGRDKQWRYIPVKRLSMQIEESARKATSVFVFEPNDSNTWGRVREMLENYLTQKWRQGALIGSRPEHAFFVNCGLDSSMTSEDIDDGLLHIEIGLALVRPAEFVVLKISHKMQSS